MGRYSNAQLDEFERQYKENRKKGTKNANEILHRENVVAKNIYQDLADAYAKQQAKQQQVPSLKANPSIGDLKKYDYAANQTPQISIGDLKRYDYAVNSRKKPSVSIGDLKQYDYAVNKKKKGMSIGDLKKKDYDMAKAKKIGNPSDRGFPSTVAPKIDFSKYNSVFMPGAASELDAYLNHMDTGFNYSFSKDRLDRDLEESINTRNWNKLIDEQFPIPALKRSTFRKDDEDYMKEFGLPKEEVLRQYEIFKEALEKQNREEHPYLYGIEDWKTAPDRALIGGLGVAAEFAFPGSDLSQILNSDLALNEVKTVQKHRDYTYDSDKLSEGQKTIAKFINEGGDMAANMLAAQAVSNILSGVGALNNASTAASFIESDAFAESPQIMGLLEQGYNLNDLRALAHAYAATNSPSVLPGVAKMAQAGAAFGQTATSKQHELEKQGVDHTKAVEMAAGAGAISAGSRYAMAGLGGISGAASEGSNWLAQALSRGGQAATLGAAGQGATELAEMLILQDDAAYSKDIQNYKLMGMSDKEAGQKAAQNLINRVGFAGLEGGLYGFGSSLLETGVGSLLNRGNAAAPEDIFVNSQEVNNGPQLPSITGSPMQNIPGGNAGLIPETTGLPALNAPLDIQLPTTASGPTIQMPTAQSGPVIALEDLVAKEYANKYPEGLITRQFEGEELANAQAEYKKNLGTIKALKDEIKIISEAKGNTRKGVLTKNAQKQIDARNAQIKELEKANKPLYRGIHGKDVPIKELLDEKSYAQIFDRQTGLVADIGYASKFAGEQGPALASQARKALNRAIESGTNEDVQALYDSLAELDRAAKEVNEVYKTKAFPEGYTYDMVFGSTPLPDRMASPGVARALTLAQTRAETMAPVESTPAIAEAAGETMPVEVDPANVIYHAGQIGRYNKSDTAGRMNPSRSTGYFGTGHYFVDSAHHKGIGSGSSRGNLPQSSVDISKYDNLFKANTDETARSLHQFGKDFMHFVDSTNDKKFTDEDGTVNDLNYRGLILNLYQEYLELFGDDHIYSLQEFENVLNQFKNEYEYDSYDYGDTAFTTFMKDHGFNGVDTRGTNYAGTDYGTVIYDLDEDSILQANVRDEAAKAGLMNTRVRNGEPIFDEEIDKKIRGSVDSQKKAKEIRREYLRSYDESDLKQIKKDLDEAKQYLQNNIEAKEGRELALSNDEAFEYELENYENYDNLSDDEFRNYVRNDIAEELQGNYERISELEQRVNDLQAKYDAEEANAKAAYDLAKAKVEGISEEDINAAVSNAVGEELNNELPSLTPEEDVLNEDIVPNIENAVANSRNYTPEEIAEINAFVAQREAINAQVEEAAGHLMTTNPADLQNLFNQLSAVDNEFYAKYPELFVNGKFAGAPKVDENVNFGYNNGTEGGTANEIQASGGYDGRGSNAVDTGIRESEPQDQGVSGTLQEGGVFLPDDRGAITEQLRSNPSVFTGTDVTALADQGISHNQFYDANNNAETFTQALATAKKNNPAGASVDGHSLEEIQSIIDNGGNCFLTDDATAGGAVEADGNLTCVFKDKLNNKTPNMGTAVALAGIKNGAVKGDCFGIFLVNAYSLAGFEPVARVNYAYGFSDAMDAYVNEQIAKGKIPGPPDVYAFKLRDGYDFDTAVAAYNDKTKAIAYTQEQLDELPLFEGDDSYGDMLAYRDSLLEGQSEQTASSVEADKGYFLRLLGDEDFLRNEAMKYAYTQQQNGAVPEMVENYMQQLRAYAAQNLGYDLPQASTPVPEMQPGMTTPSPEVPNMKVDSSDTQKTSGYYNSTMRNTEANKDMTDSEYHQYFDEGNYQYAASTNMRSVNDAKSLITKLGGEDEAIKQLLNPKFFENNEFNHVFLDATEMLADAAEKRAFALKNSGLDYSDAMRTANRLHKLAQRNITNSAQVMQATKKWKVPSPRAQIDSLIGQINAAIDKGKTKGYSNMVSDLADAIEDAVVKGGTQQEILDRIHKIFEDNRKGSDYDTKKVEGLVARYIRNSEKNPQAAEEVARIVKKEMGVSTMSYQQEIAIAELLEQAFQYEEGSRAYKECLGRALKMFDETLPPDKLPAKVRSIIYDNMLAAIRTMLTRNLGGNAVVSALDFLERPVMVGADAVTGMFTKQRTRTLSGKAIIEGFKGFGHGAKDWALDVAKNVNTGRSGQEGIEDVLKLNHNTFRTNSNNKIIKGANIAGYCFDRLVRKGMEAGDRTIYEMRYYATKAELMDVVDKFGDEGLRKGLGIKNDVDTNDLIEFIATGEALEAVFQNDSQLKQAAKGLKKMFKDSSEALIGLDVASLTMTPFIEVPSNMADVAFQHTIFGALGNLGRTIREKKKYGAFNQRRFTKEVGRNLTGLGIKAAGIGAAAAGLISGPLSDDPDERKMQQNNGYQEYAIQTPDGSTQIDISDIGVLGPYVQYSKRIYDALKEGGIKGALKEEVPALGAVTTDQLYQSLNRLTGATNRYSTDKGGLLSNVGDAIATSAASMFVPSAVRQTAQYTDDYKRDLGDYGTWEYIKNTFYNGIPGLREKMLEPKVDTSGKYVPELNGKTGIQRFLSAYVTPWKITHPTENLSKSQKYIDSIREATNGEVNPQLPVFNKKNLVGIKGYDKENYSHADLREIQENFYKKNTETSDRLIFEPWFKQLPYEKQGKYLDMLFNANKYNAMEDIVRKGLTDAEIEALGDQIYTTDNKLSQILRTDDGAYSGMLQYFKDLETIDAINQKYGTNVSYSDYKEREAKRKGGTEIYAQQKAAANELGIDLNEYRGLEDYPGGVEKGLQDKKDAQWMGLSLENYNKFADKAGDNFEQAKADYNQLRRLGFNNYNVALDYARSAPMGLTIPEFAKLFKEIDIDNRNQVFSQKEVLNYLNTHDVSDELAQQIWAIGGFKSQDGTKDTKLFKKNGKWRSGYDKE